MTMINKRVLYINPVNNYQMTPKLAQIFETFKERVTSQLEAITQLNEQLFTHIENLNRQSDSLMEQINNHLSETLSSPDSSVSEETVSANQLLQQQIARLQEENRVLTQQRNDAEERKRQLQQRNQELTLRVRELHFERVRLSAIVSFWKRFARRFIPGWMRRPSSAETAENVEQAAEETQRRPTVRERLNRTFQRIRSTIQDRLPQN